MSSINALLSMSYYDYESSILIVLLGLLGNMVGSC